MTEHLYFWMPQWYSRNRLDGMSRYLILKNWQTGQMLFFKTRKDCREYIRVTWGYIAKRPDLKAEPHGWRVPTAVRVRMTVTPAGRSSVRGKRWTE